MDSQERHDLKQNELYEFFTNFKQWWEKHGTSTLLMICAVVAGYVGINYYKNRQIRFNEQAWGALAVAHSPEALVAVADDYPGTPVASQAWLGAADMLCQQAVFGQTDPQKPKQPPVPLAPEKVHENLIRAVKLYQLVIANSHADNLPSLVALNARMGLAAAYESLREFDKAAEQYRQLQKEAGPYPLFANKAQQLLRQLDQLRQPVIFPSKPQAPPDATSSTTPALPQPELTGLPKLPNPLAPESTDKTSDSNAQTPAPPTPSPPAGPASPSSPTPQSSP